MHSFHAQFLSEFLVEFQETFPGVSTPSLIKEKKTDNPATLTIFSCTSILSLFTYLKAYLFLSIKKLTTSLMKKLTTHSYKRPPTLAVKFLVSEVGG
jgi:hypothetical protein